MPGTDFQIEQINLGKLKLKKSKESIKEMKIRKALETTIKRIKTEKAGEWIWKDRGGGK